MFFLRFIINEISSGARKFFAWNILLTPNWENAESFQFFFFFLIIFCYLLPATCTNENCIDGDYQECEEFFFFIF